MISGISSKAALPVLFPKVQKFEGYFFLQKLANFERKKKMNISGQQNLFCQNFLQSHFWQDEPLATRLWSIFSLSCSSPDMNSIT